MAEPRKQDPEDFTDDEKKRIDQYAKRADRLMGALSKITDAREARVKAAHGAGQKLIAPADGGLLVDRTPAQILFEAARRQADAMLEIDEATGFDQLLHLIVTQQQQIADLHGQLRQLTASIVMDSKPGPKRPTGPARGH